MAKMTISLDQPNRPQGELIEVPPIGLIENGTTAEIDGASEELAEWLSTLNGAKVKYAGKNVSKTFKERPAEVTYIPPELASGEVGPGDLVEPMQENFAGGGESE